MQLYKHVSTKLHYVKHCFLVCTVDTYKANAGNGGCSACAVGVSTNGQIGQLACGACAAGYYGISPFCAGTS